MITEKQKSMSARYRQLFEAIKKAVGVLNGPGKRVILVTLDGSWRWVASINRSAVSPSNPRDLSGRSCYGTHNGSSSISSDHAIDVLRRDVLKSFVRWRRVSGQYSAKRHGKMLMTLKTKVR